MAKYFEAINNGNSTLIDDQYINYALWKKGTVVTQGWAGISVGARLELSGNSTDAIPIIAIVHNEYVNLLGNYSPGPGNWNINWLMSDLHTPSGQTLEWFAFLPSSAPEIVLNQTGMLCTWNEAGEPIFDSDANYLKIVDFLSVQYQNPVAKQYPPNRKYAVVVSVNQIYVRPAQSPGGWGSLSGVCARVRSSGAANYDYIRIRSGIDGAPNPGAAANTGKTDTGVFMVIDVTDM